MKLSSVKLFTIALCIGVAVAQDDASKTKEATTSEKAKSSDEVANPPTKEELNKEDLEKELHAINKEEKKEEKRIDDIGPIPGFAKKFAKESIEESADKKKEQAYEDHGEEEKALKLWYDDMKSMLEKYVPANVRTAPLKNLKDEYEKKLNQLKDSAKADVEEDSKKVEDDATKDVEDVKADLKADSKTQAKDVEDKAGNAEKEAKTEAETVAKDAKKTAEDVKEKVQGIDDDTPAPVEDSSPVATNTDDVRAILRGNTEKLDEALKSDQMQVNEMQAAGEALRSSGVAYGLFGFAFMLFSLFMLVSTFQNRKRRYDMQGQYAKLLD